MPEEKVVGFLSDEEVAKIAREELNEDPKRVKDDIKAIKEWIKKQPHLHKSCRTGKNIFLNLNHI